MQTMRATKTTQTVFSIIGPTAVGKTDAAFQLADYFLGRKSDTGQLSDTGQKYKRVHLISVDSRQVYQGLEILTGADVPEGFVQTESPDFEYPYYEKNQLLLHGISIIKPQDEWSVAHFQQLTLPIIAAAQKNNEAVILVGGTGLYHDHLFSEDPWLHVTPSTALRSKASNLSLEELQSWLAKLNPEKFKQLNNSDLQNPRRLIRAIEISLNNPVKSNPTKSQDSNKKPTLNHRYLGVTAPLDLISEKISLRVAARFDEAKREVEIILAGDINITKPVRTTLGFSQLAAFLSEQITKEQAIEIWTLREVQYAKRQLTWWKKRPEITWIDRETRESADWQKLLAAKPKIT